MLRVTPTTTYDRAGSAKCGELYYQGSSADFSILCTFCDCSSCRTASSNKMGGDRGVSLVRRPSLLTELVAVEEPSDVEEITVLKDNHDEQDERCATINRTKEKSKATTQVTKRELSELRAQLKTELKVDLQKLEQRILALENKISKNQKQENGNDNEEIDYENKPENENKKSYGKPHEKDDKNDGITMVALPKYAFRNVEHFKTYEQLFQNNEKRFAELVSQFLNHVLVENSVQFIKLCWRKILQDKAAQHLCWRGTTTKPAIGTSVITAAIKDAYVSKFPQTFSDLEFEKTCIVYFQTAKKRFDAQSSRWHRSR